MRGGPNNIGLSEKRALGIAQCGCLVPLVHLLCLEIVCHLAFVVDYLKKVLAAFREFVWCPKKKAMFELIT